ncbi:MAG: CotH kinase family protein [Bacteroidales bacterium]|nr:CotH kinase family protein [Bacteroidales bacterium]
MDNLSVTHIYLPKALVLLLLVTGLFSCTRIEEAETQVLPENTEVTQADTKVFIGYTPSSDDATKTGLDAQAKMFWQTGDRIALFQSSTNEKYRFTGEDGDTWSEFVKEDSSVPGEAFSTNYALYPWAEGVASATEGAINFTLPSTQDYAVKSFAQSANPMVAVTSSPASNELKFQNLCGFLQLRLYGDATVRYIRFYGSNNEVLCGAATVTAAYGSEPALAMTGEGKVITLDCGEGGITLGASAGNYTPIWLLLPPTTFTKGFTFEIERTTGVVTTKSTDKSVTIVRNHALPISAIEVEQAPKMITAFNLSDGVHSYEAFDIKDDIISIQVPNGTDMSSLVASFKFEGASVSVGGVPQASGVNSQDFSDFTTPVKYVVTATDASTRTYTVRMFDLPVVTVETPGHKAIVDKVNWIEGTAISIRETNADGTSQVKDYTASIKGRGNSSWAYSQKKPYALKLDSSAEVLGMKAHKRWCLLSNTFGWFFSNMIGYEMGRRAASADWAPSGKYVELILNGEHRGCYLLTEQIKIDKNRMNITKAGKKDIEGEAVTGGWLLEFDNTFDELFKFKTALYNLPVMFKDPDDEIPDEQFNYLQDYINTLEASLKDADRRNAREYMDYIDIDTFIDQWFIREMAGRDESYPAQHMTDFKRPRSAWHYKDRGGKLKSGPVWDFDTYLFNDKVLICTTSCMYYGDLFKESGFVSRVKEKWPDFRARLDGAGGKKDMVQYLDSLYANVKLAARRDRVLWPYATHPATRSVDVQYDQLRVGLPDKLDWLGDQIAAMKVNYDNKTGGNEDFGDQKDKGDDFNFGF